MASNAFHPRDLVTAWNTHSVDKVIEHYAQDAQIESSESPDPIRGKEKVRQYVQGWFRAFPDLMGDPETTLQSGDDVALLVHLTGTHRGELEIAKGQTIQPTNRKVEMPVGVFLKIGADGKIVKERDVFDQASLAQQLGLSPEQMGQPAGQRSASARSSR